MKPTTLAEQFKSNIKPLSYFKDFSYQPLVETVFHKESMHLIWAPSGGMKSLFTFDLAIAIATGRKFLGYPTVKSKVLYLDSEMAAPDIAARVQLFNALDVDNLDYITNGDTAFNFSDPNQQKAFIHLLASSDYEVVVFDNLRTMALIDNENDSSCFQTINAFLQRIRDMGITVFLVHHSSKAADNYSGSSNIITPYNTVIGLVDAHISGYRKIIVTKQRSSGVEGLQALNEQLVSPCELRGMMILNDCAVSSEAAIAEAIIDDLDHLRIDSMEAVKRRLRELGHSFRNGALNMDTFSKWLIDTAEIDHQYTSKDKVKAQLQFAKNNPQ